MPRMPAARFQPSLNRAVRRRARSPATSPLDVVDASDLSIKALDPGAPSNRPCRRKQFAMSPSSEAVQDGTGFCIEFDKDHPDSTGAGQLGGRVPGMSTEDSERVKYVA